MNKYINFAEKIFFDWNYFWFIFTPLFLFEGLLNIIIINKVPYTEIDWVAYMQEVSGFIDGERDYSKLYGQTGPLVYPAGFVYIYSMLYQITRYGNNILLAQYIFVALYLASFTVVSMIYRNAKFMPPIGLLLLCVSKRLHSIYVLRLFNDPIAMFFMYFSILCLQKKKILLSSVCFSLALSVKMNILLFLPAFGVLLLWAVGLVRTFLYVVVLIGYPFLSTYPHSYIKGAFDFGRVFMYKWTVNWKFISKDVFESKELALFLLVSFVFTSLLFIHVKWLKQHGGLLNFLLKRLKSTFSGSVKYIDDETFARVVPSVLFTGNFIGIIFSRSLHYQFYSWYYWTLPYLLWLAFYPRHGKRNSWKLLPVFIICILNLSVIEYCWNVYPSNESSSLLLLCEHLALIVMIYLQSESFHLLKENDSNFVMGKSNKKVK